ncbi:MAG: MltA domain-containing protein [Methylocapsa sp.]|nr:MltA domain-containing protein [Methylocapsa sp.]
MWGDIWLSPASFCDLAGFSEDDHADAFSVFAHSCAAIASRSPPLRKAMPAPAPLEAVARKALSEVSLDNAGARRFFESHFRPWRIVRHQENTGRAGFLTGYYEPVVEGSLCRSREFTAPVLGPPDDLYSVRPYHDRATIDSAPHGSFGTPLVWLRDRIEVFMIQVQGSAQVRLPCGRFLRLVYAGRNGQPYTSIGRILTESGAIAESAMSLAALKQWLRANGQNPGYAGLALMHQNKSFVFFALREVQKGSGPTGGQGIGLSALRSIAIDRTIWSYGLPFWISAELPWRGSSASPFQRLMIAQDTGSAIAGSARCDIFFGSGDDAGARAGDIRHQGEFWVLLPRKRGSADERKSAFPRPCADP